MLERIGGSPRLYRWLLVLGIVTMASPVPLTISSHGTLASYREWALTVSHTVDSLTVLRNDAETAGDPNLPQYATELADRTAALDRAMRSLDRAQRRAEQLWQLNGLAPLLLATGAGLLLLGLRLRRFEQFGE